VSPDNSHVYVRRNVASPTEAGLRVIDTRTWQVSTFDPAATGAAYSPDGRWLYLEEPRLASRAGAPWTPQRMHVRQAEGARVRVVDTASGDEVASLLQDRVPIQLIAYGTDRLYAVVPGPEYPVGPWPLAIQPGDPKARVELIAYEVGTWRELARRPSPFPLLLVGGPSMLGDPMPL
jgi:hypothetical protein